jgi:hypothetical protein
VGSGILLKKNKNKKNVESESGIWVPFKINFRILKN